MKAVLLLFICSCMVYAVQAQHKTIQKKTHRRYGTRAIEAPPPPQVFIYVEENAEFPGGTDALLKFINTHLHYPGQARENGIAGKVMIAFAIDQGGNVSDISVLRGIDGSCDQEAQRVVRSMPRWKPAKKNGRAVKSYFVLPVRFAME